MMTLREFIKEATELCNGDLDTKIYFLDGLNDYLTISLDHDGDDLIIEVDDVETES